MATSQALQGTTVIVGAGVFGTSTAYHLSQSIGDGTVIIIDQHDFPTPDADSAYAPLGASYDINKIVRADYTSKFHMQMALEAIEKWRSWELLSPFYHQSGWIVTDEVDDTPMMEQIGQNFRDCKGEDEALPLPVDELKKIAGGAFQGIDIDPNERAYSNPEVAWAEADKSVGAMLSEAVRNGVQYRKGKVERLILSSSSTGVEGVALQDGTIIRAERVLLATGAWTSALTDGTEELLDLPNDQRAESQVKAAGVCNVHLTLSDAAMNRYRDIPIFIRGSLGDVLPPSNSKLLKINNSTSFTNTVRTPSGRYITRPSTQSQFEISEIQKEETLEVVRKVMPQLLTSESEVSFFRLCWDAITPEQHQLITRHPSPRLKNLFFAVGGSFHGWKFLPTIGHYISNVLRGISNGKEKDDIWGWKREGWAAATNGGAGGAHEDLIPRREFSSLLDTKD